MRGNATGTIRMRYEPGQSEVAQQRSQFRNKDPSIFVCARS